MAQIVPGCPYRSRAGEETPLVARLGRGGEAGTGAAYLSCGAGRVWFEVDVLEAKGWALVGFAGNNFRGSPRPLVGFDAVSWSIDEGGQAYHR